MASFLCRFSPPGISVAANTSPRPNAAAKCIYKHDNSLTNLGLGIYFPEILAWVLPYIRDNQESVYQNHMTSIANAWVELVSVSSIMRYLEILLRDRQNCLPWGDSKWHSLNYVEPGSKAPIPTAFSTPLQIPPRPVSCTCCSLRGF